MGVEHRPNIVAYRNAKFLRRRRNDRQCLAKLLLRVIAESRARVARGLGERRRSVRTFLGNPVEHGAAAPTEMIIGHDADARRCKPDPVAPIQVSGLSLRLGAFRNQRPGRLKVACDGDWLLHVRGKLLGGEPIDLREGPTGVTWVELDGREDHKKRLHAARVNPPTRDGRVLIIGDSKSPDSRNQFASQTPGAVTVEAVDLRDLVAFARRFDLAAPDALQQIAQFAQSVMTNVGAADLVSRVQTLHGGRAQKPATDLERVCACLPACTVASRSCVPSGRNRQAGRCKDTPPCGIKSMHQGASALSRHSGPKLCRCRHSHARAKQADRTPIAKARSRKHAASERTGSGGCGHPRR